MKNTSVIRTSMEFSFQSYFVLVSEKQSEKGQRVSDDIDERLGITSVSLCSHICSSAWIAR